MTAPYSAGTVTLVNGSTALVGNDTAWETALVTGGIMCVEAAGNILPIASVEGETAATAGVKWIGSDGTYDYYILREQTEATKIKNLNDRLAQILAKGVAWGIPPSFIGTMTEIEALDLGVDDDQFVACRFEEDEGDAVVEFYRWDGTGWIGPWDPKGEGGGPGEAGIGDRFDVAIFVQGKPSAGELLFRHVFADTGVSFAAGLSASRASAVTPATADAVFSLEKNGSAFGTVTFAASGDTGTFAAAAPADFAAGDVLTVLGPSPRDDTLADISITIAGDRDND